MLFLNIFLCLFVIWRSKVSARRAQSKRKTSFSFALPSRSLTWAKPKCARRAQSKRKILFSFALPSRWLTWAKPKCARRAQSKRKIPFSFALPSRRLTWARPKSDLEQSGRVVLSVVKQIIPSSQLLWDGIEGVSECFLQVPQSG